MTAKWTVNTQEFIDNVTRVTNGQLIMAVVKNNAYHFGLEFAVQAFQAAGIYQFSTTSLEEAKRIRQLAPDAMIFLMNPSTEFSTLKQYNIQMTLPSIEFYKQYAEELQDVQVHLEYENLLHRSGFKTFEQIQQVIELNQQSVTPMHITGIWTHFGYADEFDVTDYDAEKQAWLDGLDTLSYDFKYIHAQNSASFVRDGLFKHHIGRLGIILYGARPYSCLPDTITKQALTVSANVIQVRNLEKGQSAGYSFAFTAEQATRLAVIDIGYGDGILRTRSQFDCIINNHRYPIEALMMSHMFVAVDSTVHAGDQVILYSNDIRIDEFTFKGVGANSEQLSALNHHSLIKEYI